jgi:hypothetical protein
MRPSHLTEDQCFELSGNYVGYNVTCEDAGCPEVYPGDIDSDGQVGSVDILTVIELEPLPLVVPHHPAAPPYARRCCCLPTSASAA